MEQNFNSSSELDRMKADAIKRARQMHLRATNLFPAAGDTGDAHGAKAPKIKNEKGTFSKNGILDMIRVLGFENDQLILIALILMLSSSEENFPLVLALLYIAL